MSLTYLGVEDAMQRPGLRMVVVGGVPSGWSEAASAAAGPLAQGEAPGKAAPASSSWLLRKQTLRLGGAGKARPQCPCPRVR